MKIAVLLIAAFTLCVSCGRKNDGGSGSGVSAAQEIMREDGEYRIIFEGVNDIEVKATATLQISEEGPKLRYTLNSPSGHKTKEKLTTAPCPDASDDSNGDGFIDIEEAVLDEGEIIGDFGEEQVKDLQAPLAGSQVIILGVPSGLKLPQTVATFEQLGQQESLPMACGKVVFVPHE